MKRTTAVLSALGVAAGAVATVLGVRVFKARKAGKTAAETAIDDNNVCASVGMAEEDIPDEVKEIIAAVEVAAEAAPGIGQEVAEIQKSTVDVMDEAEAEIADQLPKEE